MILGIAAGFGAEACCVANHSGVGHLERTSAEIVFITSTKITTKPASNSPLVFPP